MGKFDDSIRTTEEQKKVIDIPLLADGILKTIINRVEHSTQNETNETNGPMLNSVKTLTESIKNNITALVRDNTSCKPVYDVPEAIYKHIITSRNTPETIVYHDIFSAIDKLANWKKRNPSLPLSENTELQRVTENLRVALQRLFTKWANGCGLKLLGTAEEKEETAEEKQREIAEEKQREIAKRNETIGNILMGIALVAVIFSISYYIYLNMPERTYSSQWHDGRSVDFKNPDLVLPKVLLSLAFPPARILLFL